MKTYKLERELYDPVMRYLGKNGIIAQVKEESFFEYKVDIFGTASRGGMSVAVELKLDNWRRAIEQAVLYQLCADYVYIALPEPRAVRIDRTILKGLGVGLIAVRHDGSCLTIVPAVESAFIDPGYADFYRHRIWEAHEERTQNFHTIGNAC